MKKIIIALVLAIFTVGTINAQLEIIDLNLHQEKPLLPPPPPPTTKYQVVEKQPEFPGGMKALMKYLRDNIKQNVSQGRTFVNFVVNTDGSIQDIAVLRSSGDVELDNEAVRVVSSMPKWKPGESQGKAVSVRFTLPITFRGVKKGNTKEPQDVLQKIENGLQKIEDGLQKIEKDYKKRN
ncbi:MAG: energy transducer TonB [Bacteroidaceae bacterium]|nr:energy transducer TonB [Bacteroidaceae bacterium]